jgi:uncharacterized membrane protein
VIGLSDRADQLFRCSGYADASAARQDWDGIKTRVRDTAFTVRGLVLVARDEYGWVGVKVSARGVGKGAVIGALAGAVVALVFSPAILVTAAAGAGIGVALGSIFESADSGASRAGAEEVLPPGSTGVIVFFEDRWIDEVDKTLRMCIGCDQSRRRRCERA